MLVVGTESLQAVLFDMDGTIIDSEPYWMRAERELVESFGGTWSDEQGYALVGSGLWNSASLIRAAGVELELDDIVHHLSNRVLEQIKDSVPWRPGVREVLGTILQRGLPCALVTMSLRKNAEALAEAVAQELGAPVFHAIISGDDVSAPKPNPEAYLSGSPGVRCSDFPRRGYRGLQLRRCQRFFCWCSHDWYSPACRYTPGLRARNLGFAGREVSRRLRS